MNIVEPSQQYHSDQLPHREFLFQETGNKSYKSVLKRSTSLDEEHFPAVASCTTAKKSNRQLNVESEIKDYPDSNK